MISKQLKVIIQHTVTRHMAIRMNLVLNTCVKPFASLKRDKTRCKEGKPVAIKANIQKYRSDGI